MMRLITIRVCILTVMWSCDQVAEYNYNENILQQSSKIYKKNKHNTDLMCTVFLALCVLTVSSYKFR